MSPEAERLREKLRTLVDCRFRTATSGDVSAISNTIVTALGITDEMVKILRLRAYANNSGLDAATALATLLEVSRHSIPRAMHGAPNAARRSRCHSTETTDG